MKQKKGFADRTFQNPDIAKKGGVDPFQYLWLSPKVIGHQRGG